MNYDLGGTIIREEEQDKTETKCDKILKIKETGSFPINVTEKSGALQNFAKKLIEDFKKESGGLEGTYTIEKINLFGGASNYYGGKVEPDYGNDYKPWKQSKDYENNKNTTFTGNKTKNNQLALKRAENVLEGLKKLLLDEGPKLGVIYDPKMEPKLTSGTIFTNNLVDKKGSGLNPGQIVSIDTEICFIKKEDPEKNPEKEPEKNPEKEPEKNPEKEPEKEPEKNPEKEPENDVGNANGETESGEQGDESNNYVGKILKYNFGTASKVTVQIDPLIVPDAFFINYGSQNKWSGFIGQKYSDRHFYSKGVDFKTKRMVIDIMPKFAKKQLEKFAKNETDLSAFMEKIPRNFMGEIYKLNKDYNLVARINDEIKEYNFKIGANDIVPQNSETVNEKIINISKGNNIYGRMKQIYGEYEMKEKKFTFTLNREEGENDITIIAFAPLSKTEFTINAKCEGEENLPV